MHKKMNSGQIEELKSKGIDVKEHPRLVKGEMNVPALVKAVEDLTKAQIEATKSQHTAIMNAIDRLAEVIAKKESKDLDLSKLIEAVASLKQEATAIHEPVDYLMTAERDPQRHLIDVEKGIRFTAVPKRLN